MYLASCDFVVIATRVSSMRATSGSTLRILFTISILTLCFPMSSTFVETMGKSSSPNTYAYVCFRSAISLYFWIFLLVLRL